MKFVNKSLGEAADISSEKHSAFRELRWLLVASALLATGLYWVIGFGVDAVVSRISFETESKLFSSAALLFMKTKQGDPRIESIQEMLDTLASDPKVPPLKYNIIILENQKPNAFAFPGGVIGVTEGLLETLEEEIALAFVLGHELGHFYNRDHLRGIGRSLGASVIYSIVFGGQMGSEAIEIGLQSVLAKTYSRQHEQNADQFGVELVFRVHGKTEGVDRLFKLLEKKDDLPSWGYMFSTHPSPKSRIAELKQHIQRMEKVESSSIEAGKR